MYLLFVRHDSHIITLLMQKVEIANIYIINISVWFNKDARKDNHDQKWSVNPGIKKKVQRLLAIFFCKFLILFDKLFQTIVTFAASSLKRKVENRLLTNI